MYVANLVAFVYTPEASVLRMTGPRRIDCSYVFESHWHLLYWCFPYLNVYLKNNSKIVANIYIYVRFLLLQINFYIEFLNYTQLCVWSCLS